LPVSTTYKALLLLLGAALAAGAQPTFVQCDINKDNSLNVTDVQGILGETLGTTTPALDDLNGDNVVNVIDVQIVINGVLGVGCLRDISLPTFASVSVTLMNQAWIPADIPSPGVLTIHGSFAASATVLNQYWIPADIPSPGNITINSAYSLAASLLNQAWISADIPSAGNLNFVAGLLISVNNTSGSQSPLTFLPNTRIPVVAGGSSTTPVDLKSVNDGDGMIAGQTVRFRIFPPDPAASGSDFLLDGSALQIHAPFEVMVTAPANVPTFDLQAVVYSADGRAWQMPAKHLLVFADPGLTMDGHAVHGDGSPASSATVGVQTNGLVAEYFRADPAPASWAVLNQTPDKSGFVTALNQPNPNAIFGPDPFGTGLSGSYVARFRGQILIAAAGEHRFFLDAALGARLLIDGAILIDAPPGRFSAESQAQTALAAGWHAIEIESYQTAVNPRLQLSWQQPHAAREVVRPESLASDLSLRTVTGATGSFHLEAFPSILNPLEWHTVPANQRIRVVLDQSISQERPIQQ
jgi:hypothetical protein